MLGLKLIRVGKRGHTCSLGFVITTWYSVGKKLFVWYWQMRKITERMKLIWEHPPPNLTAIENIFFRYSQILTTAYTILMYTPFFSRRICWLCTFKQYMKQTIFLIHFTHKCANGGSDKWCSTGVFPSSLYLNKTGLWLTGNNGRILSPDNHKPIFRCISIF